MALDEILRDLLSKSLEVNNSPGSMRTDPPGHNKTLQPSPESLIIALERECGLHYEDPGPGIHFIGLLLVVFATEIVSGYWAKNVRRIRAGGGERGPARLVSCLYSGKAVRFALAHPMEVLSQFAK